MSDLITASNYISNRYYSSSARNVGDLTSEILNPSISFTGKTDNLQFNFAVTCQQKETINISIGQQQASLQEMQSLLVFDVDVYKEQNITDNLLDKYFRSTEKFISEKIAGYIKRVQKL